MTDRHRRDPRAFWHQHKHRHRGWVVLGLLGLWLLGGGGWPAQAHREAVSVRQFGGKGESPGRFGETTFWDFDAQGNLYVSDVDNLRVQKLTPDGQWLLTIEGQQEEAPFTLRNPSDIAVDARGILSVADWGIFPVALDRQPALYTYAPCVHQFRADGSWLRTFPLDPPEDQGRFMERAVPGLDAEGREVLIIPQGDTERTFRLSSTADGTLFVLDEGKLYRFSPSGERLGVAYVGRRYPAWLQGITDLVAADASRIYLVDTARHRILQIDASGELQRVIGEYGTGDGQFKSPIHLAVLQDGSLLVADRAFYDRAVESLLPRRRDDPSARGLLESLGQRRLRVRFLRAQRLSPEGRFLEKILIRVERDRADQRDLRWLAVSPSGTMYLQHADTLVVERFLPTEPITWKALRVEVGLHWEQDEVRTEIDNPEDLDVRRDFDETWKIQLASAALRLHYDYNERVRLSWYHHGLYLFSRADDFYAQTFEDIARGAFNQSDKTLEEYVAGTSELRLNWVLSDEPYDFRTAGLSLYLGGGRYNVINDAIDVNNQRYLDWQLWFTEWGGGFHYDLNRRWNVRLDVTHGPAYGFFNYEFDYIDELGKLFATGFREGDETQVLFGINGVF